MEAETLFFSLLQSELFGKFIPAEASPSLPHSVGDADALWKAVWTIAKMQGVDGLIADAVLCLPPDYLPPKPLLSKMQSTTMGAMRANIMTDNSLKRSVAILRRHGIEPVLLKGQGAASLYPNPKMRTCGDIDLYIGEEDYSAACRIALEELADAGAETHKTEKHFAVYCDGVKIELHRRATEMLKPSRRKAVLQWETEWLGSLIIDEKQKCNPGGRQSREILLLQDCELLLPPVTFNAVYLFLHLWYHFLTEDGVGLRQLCDWAMLLHRHAAEIDRSEVEQVLRRFDVLRGWQMLGHIVVEQLGLPAEEMPLYAAKAPRKTPKALRRIMQRGNFGMYAPDLRNEDPRSMSFLKLKRVRTVKFIRKYYDAAQFAPIDFTRYFAPVIWRAVSNSALQFLGLRGRE